MSTSTPVRSEANLVPVSDVNELKLWWNPDLPDGGYRAYIVQVTDRQPAPLGSVTLTFDLVGEAAMQLPPEKREGLTVDLYNAPHAVWPELPTTIANAQVGQFGFLLLSDAYITAKTDEQDPSVIAESGGKYPLSAATKVLERKQGAPACP